MLKTFDPEGFPEPVKPIPFVMLATMSQTGMSFVQQGLIVSAVFFANLYHLTLTQMGLVTTALAFGVTSAMVIMGLVVDRTGPRPLLFVGSGVASVLACCLVFAHGFVVLLGLLYCLGVVLAIVPSTGTKAVFTAFAGRARGAVMGIRQAGVPLGAMLAASLLPRLIQKWGFHVTFLVFAAELLVFGWLFSGSMHREPRKDPNVRVSQKVPDGSVLRAILPACIVAVLVVSGQYIILGFTLKDLSLVHHLPLATGGLILAAGQLGGGVGRIMGGAISDRLGNRPSVVITSYALLAAAMSLAVAVLPARTPVAVLGFTWFVFGIGAVGWNALAMTWAGSSVPAAHSGFAMSSVGTSAYLGAAVFSPLFGKLVDVTGHFATGWLAISVVLGVAASLSWKFTRRHRKSSQADRSTRQGSPRMMHQEDRVRR